MAIFSAQSCCSNTIGVIDVPSGLGGGSVGQFYFSTGSTGGFYGCWELLGTTMSSVDFTATTGPYTSCTECRSVDKNE